MGFYWWNWPLSALETHALIPGVEQSAPVEVGTLRADALCFM